MILAVKFRKVRIKFKTFLKPGFKAIQNKFGIYCYCGKQGNGKTYSVVEFLNQNRSLPIYANMKSIKGIDYVYYEGFKGLLELNDKTDCIIVFDEIFTALTKGGKKTAEILTFLSQMRKKNVIFITTAQEWLEIDMTFRRYCRFQIDCNMFNFINSAILFKRMYDATQMKWSQEDNEYIAPLITTTISKGNKKIINSYDTFEQVPVFK